MKSMAHKPARTFGPPAKTFPLCALQPEDCDGSPWFGRGQAALVTLAMGLGLTALAARSAAGQVLPTGPKPFVDDGNCFWASRIPAITHGPRAGGPHTIHEWVSIDDLVRVAQVYALTAVAYC